MGMGGAFNKHDQLYALSWGSLLASGATMQTKFMFTVIRKSDMVADTLDELLRSFCWSVNVLLTGRTPMADWNGHPLEGGDQPLCGDYLGVLCQARGDWQWYCQSFYFPQWNCAEIMCPFCRASNTIANLLYTDCSENAAWRDTQWSHNEYLAYRGRRGLPIPIMFLAGVGAIGFLLSCVNIDVLHCVDQGIASHIIGNIMWYIAVIRNHFGGHTYDIRISRLQARLKDWYRQTNCKSRMQGDLTKERLRTSKGWPKLKGKAAATRHLAHFAFLLMCEFCDVAHPKWGEHDVLAKGVIQLLCRFYELIDDESMFLSDSGRTDVKFIGNTLGHLYAQLSSLSFDVLNLKLWKMSPKLHLFMHLCLHQAPVIGNPRYFWTYGDEDLIGQLVDIAKGVHPSTLALSVLFKWVICVFDDLLISLDN